MPLVRGRPEVLADVRLTAKQYAILKAMDEEGWGLSKTHTGQPVYELYNDDGDAKVVAVSDVMKLCHAGLLRYEWDHPLSYYIRTETKQRRPRGKVSNW